MYIHYFIIINNYKKTLMHLIAHRINTIKHLQKINTNYGIEVDIRDDGNNLIIVHDPFKKGEKLENFLKFYKHRILIANIKSERIEDKVIKILKKFKIKNYFFLDSSFPKIIDLIKKKFNKIALRVSYYENVSTAEKLKGKVKWIWYEQSHTLSEGLSTISWSQSWGGTGQSSKKVRHCGMI